LAHPKSLTLPEILAGLSGLNEYKRTVPIPACAVMGGLRLLERARVPIPFRSDSLLGLVEAAACLPGQDLLARSAVRFRCLTA
jgi:hypothetical protein